MIFVNSNIVSSCETIITVAHFLAGFIIRLIVEFEAQLIILSHEN